MEPRPRAEVDSDRELLRCVALTVRDCIVSTIGWSMTPDTEESHSLEVVVAHPQLIAARPESVDLPPFIDLMTAANLLGIGRTLAYALVRAGRWPTPIVRVGHLIRVPSAALLALGEKDPAGDLDQR